MHERSAEREIFASAEDVRMVRAIAFLALIEAVRRGESRATFRGFLVHAARVSTSRSNGTIHVDLCVSFGESVVERSVIALSDSQYAGSIKQHADGKEADDVEPMMAAAVT